MVHPNDEQSLQRLLGCDTLPPEVVAEYELRVGMFHRDGNTGPLRTLALIELVRFLGLQPARVVEKVQKIDWRQYPQNGTTHIEARFFGSWMPGVFLGFVEGGTIAVRLDGDAMVRECRQDMVRLSADPDPFADVKDEPPDARAALLATPDEERKPLNVILASDCVSHRTGDDEPFDLNEPEPTVEEIDLDGPPEPAEFGPIDSADVFDWSVAPEGAPVWVDVEGKDIVDGRFYGVAENGNILVELDGDDQKADFDEFEPERVTYAGDAT